jgi:hypothetical protein
MFVFCRWAYFSSVLILSNRLIFTYSDVSDDAKNAIAAALIAVMLVILIRTIGLSLYRKVRRRSAVSVNYDLLTSLTPEDKVAVSQALTEFRVLRHKKTLEFEQDYALNSQAASILFSIAKASGVSSPISSKVRVVSKPLPEPGTAEGQGTDVQEVVATQASSTSEQNT